VLRVFNRLVDLELILLRTYSPTDWWDITRTLGPCCFFNNNLSCAGFLHHEAHGSRRLESKRFIRGCLGDRGWVLRLSIVRSLIYVGDSGRSLVELYFAASRASAPLFLRKLVLGIPAQASGKNHVAINAFGAPIRPAFVSLRHIIASSMLTP